MGFGWEVKGFILEVEKYEENRGGLWIMVVVVFVFLCFGFGLFFEKVVVFVRMF